MADVTLPDNAPKADLSRSKDVPLTPEQQFDKASEIGRGLLHLTREREAAGFSTFIPRSERFSDIQIASLTKPEVITEEAIRQARLCSFGLTLEVARQIASGDIDRNSGGIHE